MHGVFGSACGGVSCLQAWGFRVSMHGVFVPAGGKRGQGGSGGFSVTGFSVTGFSVAGFSHGVQQVCPSLLSPFLPLSLVGSL